MFDKPWLKNEEYRCAQACLFACGAICLETDAASGFVITEFFFAKDRQRLLDPDDRVSRTKMNVFILVSVQTVHKHFPVYYFLDHLKGLNF